MSCPAHILQIYSECRDLIAIFREHRPQSIVEIGVHLGGTLCQWIEHAQPSARILAIDVDLPLWRKYLYASWARPRGVRLKCIEGDSRSANVIGQVRDFSAPIDFLFIDGDHRYDPCRVDYESYRPLMRPGGLVVFHDIVQHPPEEDCHVHRFWNELKMTGVQYHEIIQDCGPGRQKWAGIGVVRMI